jgi:hypothetical protein
MGSRVLGLSLVVGLASTLSSCTLSQTSSTGARLSTITTSDAKGGAAASCVSGARFYEKGVRPFDVKPVTAQIGSNVGIAIYGESSSANPGIWVCGLYGSWQYGGPGQSISPDQRPVEVIVSGIGLDNEIWALVRVPSSTTSVRVSVSGRSASTLLLHDGFAVLSFTNDKVGPIRRWAEPPRWTYKLGTVTGFDRQGFITGSDVITVCYAAPEFCGGTLKHRPSL